MPKRKESRLPLKGCKPAERCDWHLDCEACRGADQMDAREGCVPWAGVAESSYRRGYQQAVEALAGQLEGCQSIEDVFVVLRRARRAALDLRISDKKVPHYMHVFASKINGRPPHLALDHPSLLLD